MSNHCAIIGDIRQSRDIENWPEIFRLLTDTLEEVNSRFAGAVLIPFNPTVGDEFQGALKTPRHAYDVYTFIKASIPVHVYFGLGIGVVEKTQSDDKGLRGSAFYRARESLELCKTEEGLIRLRTSDHPRNDEISNTLLKFIDLHEINWTDRQREIIYFYRIHPTLTHRQIGERFSIAQSTVTKIMKAAFFPIIKESEQVVFSRLSES
jgi:hypothetical protein